MCQVRVVAYTPVMRGGERCIADQSTGSQFTVGPLEESRKNNKQYES